MSDDEARKPPKVGGPIPLSVATESVLFGGMLEQQLGRVVLAVAGVALCWWMTTKSKR